MAESIRYKWEDENEECIRAMLVEKFKQVTEFREQVCKPENKGKLFAEATKSIRWGSGLLPFVTANTSPNTWPGRNLLGKMITDMARRSDDIIQEI